jgi:hypothetical protein
MVFSDDEEEEEYSVADAGKSMREKDAFSVRESISTAEKRRTLGVVVENAAKRLSLNPNDRMTPTQRKKGSSSSAQLNNLVGTPFLFLRRLFSSSSPYLCPPFPLSSSFSFAFVNTRSY